MQFAPALNFKALFTAVIVETDVNPFLANGRAELVMQSIAPCDQEYIIILTKLVSNCPANIGG